MDELYEALRTAEAEGRTADVKRLIEYINQIPAEEKQPSNVALPAELAMLGGAGATAKQVGEYGLKGTRNVVAKVEQIIEGMKKLEDLKNAPVEEVAKTKLTPTQKYAIKMHGGIYTPLQDMSKAYSAGEEATAFKAANPAWEVRQGSSIALPPDLKASATAAKTQVAAPSVLNRVQQAVEPITSSLKSIGAPLKFIGKFVTPIAGGFEAGMQGGEAINRAEVGDVPGTVISGLGALGSAAMMSGNPLFAVPGAAASITAPQINKYLDLLRQGRIVHGAPAYEQTTPMGENYANGGLVYLAGGGAISTEEAQRQIKEWLEKNKPVPERTYTERLRDMGRDPSIPGSPIIKNTPPSKGMSGGAGFTPGTMNPFNPDSPINRATGGGVKKPDASSIAGIETNITPQERAIVDYHRNTIASGNVGRDERGYPVTVYSSTVDIPYGPYAGKVATVPGYYDNQIHNDPREIYAKWAEQIDQGKWPIYYDPRTGDTRAKYIHGIMDQEKIK